MFNTDKNVVNPFEIECIDCEQDIWDVILHEKQKKSSSTYIRIEKFADDSIY